MFRAWERGYQNILGKIFLKKSRGIVLVVCVVLLFFGSLFLASKIGFEFMPEMDRGEVGI
jgi:multidrug efflux pump subunit AcrB